MSGGGGSSSDGGGGGNQVEELHLKEAEEIMLIQEVQILVEIMMIT